MAICPKCSSEKCVKDGIIQGKDWVFVLSADFWKPYEHFVPSEMHIQSKAETYTVEGYNSLFRHFLARLRKEDEMLQ